MAAPLDTVLEIETPEHLAFRTRIAGPARRLFAWLLDLVVRGGIVLFIAVASSVVGTGPGLGVLLFTLFLIDWFYFVACELLTGGRSPGKMALKLRVVRTNGLPIGWRESVLRNLVRAADLMLVPPYLLFLGPLVMAHDPKFRRLGDLVGSTIVVAEDAVRVRHTAAVDADPRLLDELPARVPLDREDLEALELFVNREHMSTERRHELSAIITPLYAARLNIPEPRDRVAFLAALWTRAQGSSRREPRDA